MAYFQELNPDLQEEIVSILYRKVAQNKEHKKNARMYRMNFLDYMNEVVDNWLNTNNYDLSNREWLRRAEKSDI